MNGSLVLRVVCILMAGGWLDPSERFFLGDDTWASGKAANAGSCFLTLPGIGTVGDASSTAMWLAASAAIAPEWICAGGMSLVELGGLCSGGIRVSSMGTMGVGCGQVMHQSQPSWPVQLLQLHNLLCTCSWSTWSGALIWWVMASCRARTTHALT